MRLAIKLAIILVIGAALHAAALRWQQLRDARAAAAKPDDIIVHFVDGGTPDTLTADQQRRVADALRANAATYANP